LLKWKPSQDDTAWHLKFKGIDQQIEDQKAERRAQQRREKKQRREAKRMEKNSQCERVRPFLRFLQTFSNDELRQDIENHNRMIFS
jgi:hypothetical protein